MLTTTSRTPVVFFDASTTFDAKVEVVGLVAG